MNSESTPNAQTESNTSVVKRHRRSVSQYKQYQQCPRQFELQRLEKKPSRPAAWYPQGTAVHGAIEYWERSYRLAGWEELEAEYARIYDGEVDKYCDVTPNFEWWFGSGEYYPPEQDLPRRFDKGLVQLRRTLDYYETPKGREERPRLMPDGETWGVELAFEIALGDVPVVGYIDAVIRNRDMVWARDYKTGKRDGDAFQLGVYREALRQQYGVQTRYGDFYKVENQKPSKLIDLIEYDEQALIGAFYLLDEEVEAGNFPAKPSEDNCRFCGVRDFCSDKV